MSRESACGIVNNILLVSASVLYRKIVKEALSELLRDAVLISENTEPSALSRLEEFKADLVIIDTAVVADAREFSVISSVYPDIPEILLCNQKEFEYCYTGSKADLEERIDKKLLHFIVKPINEDYGSNLKIIKRGLKLILSKLLGEGKEESKSNSSTESKADEEKYSILLVAASTGGPVALENFFSALPKKLNLPILIVQHMPAVFTKNLANNLSRQFSINISEASNGDVLKNGKVLIAPGGYHMLVDKDRKIALSEEEAVNGVKPSADILFLSVAEQFRGEKVLAVILTGMGSDGADGVSALKKSCRCFCIAQNEESCTVYGMPRAIVEAGLHDRVVNLNSIPGLISRILRINSLREEDI